MAALRRRPGVEEEEGALRQSRWTVRSDTPRMPAISPKGVAGEEVQVDELRQRRLERGQLVEHV